MIKIIAASDNHGYLEPIEEILKTNFDADYYFHLGDCCCNPKLLHPFISVKGNNDYSFDLVDYRVIEIDENNRAYLIHGHQYTFNKEKMISDAKELKCNIIFCGHTHCFSDDEIDGIRIINPGSCLYNRDRSTPSYAEININNNEIKVIKKELKQII